MNHKKFKLFEQNLNVKPDILHNKPTKTNVKRNLFKPFNNI